MNSKTTRYSKKKRLIVATIIFGIIGALVHLFIQPLSIDTGSNNFTLALLPFALIFGGISAILAYIFSGAFKIILSSIGGGSN